MKNIKVKILMLFALTFIVSSQLLSVEDIILLPRLGHRKGQIKFNHKSHTQDFGTKCIDCHHSGENKKCSTCHLQKDQGEIMKLRDAYHQQCRSCHKKTSGPVACGKCHKIYQ